MQSNPLSVTSFLSNHLELSAIREEDLLDLQMSVMEEPEAYYHAEKCYTHLRINNHQLSQLLCDQIPFKAFEDRFIEISNRRRNEERYITCLQVYFGLENGELKIHPVYQPVYLKWIEHNVSMQKDLYTIPSYGYGSNYVFDGTDFESISEDDKGILIGNYQHDMSLIRTPSGTVFKSFDPLKDVESCLIPFQLIYKLMHETPSTELFVTNAMRELNSDASSPMKHIVMISGLRVEEASVRQAKYANRSHLCPPCTTSFGFDLA